MKKALKYTPVIIVIILTLVNSAATLANEDRVDDGNGDIIIYYFHVEECKDCKEAGILIEELEENYQIEVIKFEIGHNATNRELYRTFMKAYDVPMLKRDISALFIGDKYLVGKDTNKKNIEAVLRNSTQGIDPLLLVNEWQQSAEKTTNETAEEKVDLTLSLVIGTALVDGVNPCTFAVLILLLSYLLSVKEKKRVLTIGMAFTASVFTTYLLVGLGIIEYFLFSDAIEIIRSIVIIVAISAGVINIRDFWKNKATLAIPTFAKGTISSLANNAAIPSAILLGFFATLVELPCTGGIYLPILTLLAKTPSKAIFYLLAYNLVYILPLLVIIVIVYRGFSPEDVEGWRKERRGYMRLIGGLVMVGIGVGMLFGVI